MGVKFLQAVRVEPLSVDPITVVGTDQFGNKVTEVLGVDPLANAVAAVILAAKADEVQSSAEPPRVRMTLKEFLAAKLVQVPPPVEEPVQTIADAYREFGLAAGLRTLTLVHKLNGNSYPVIDVDRDHRAYVYDRKRNFKFWVTYKPTLEVQYKAVWG